MTRHTATITEQPTCRDVVVGKFTAQVTFDWTNRFDGSWDEPSYRAYGEVVSVKQVSGPEIPLCDLYKWAGDWMDDQTDLEEIPLDDEPTFDRLKAAYARQGVVLVGAGT